MIYAYIKVNDIITICHPTPHCIQPDHPHYEHILDVLENERDEDLAPFLQPIKLIQNQITGYPDLRLKGDTLRYKDKPVPSYVASKILELYKLGKPIDRLYKFLTNLDENPSNRVREQLYRFLERGQLPITENGTFLAYKKINADYTDCHTSTIKQEFNKPVTMDRNLVDDDPDISCSHGLHVCSFAYLRTFDGERIITTEVNPRDVVCVPYDYVCAKMRVCKYIPRNEIPLNVAENIWAQTPFPDTHYDDDETDKEEYIGEDD